MWIVDVIGLCIMVASSVWWKQDSEFEGQIEVDGNTGNALDLLVVPASRRRDVYVSAT